MEETIFQTKKNLMMDLAWKKELSQQIVQDAQ